MPFLYFRFNQQQWAFLLHVVAAVALAVVIEAVSEVVEARMLHS